AMTLYGLLEVARGPGLSFTNLIAPFSLSNDVLELRDARAYGPSLGFTAKGTVDLARDTLAVEGTIVPAYFFNSLLGHIPLIGRLFSPERGGGVFAATYRVRGPFADPEVSVNPLAALTPGFLRGLFGFLGDGADAPAPEPDPHGMNRGGG
ncbi:MAG: AsmA-like C-terminal region-containing protein, partial [Elioraea tepidiphila]